MGFTSGQIFRLPMTTNLGARLFSGNRSQISPWNRVIGCRVPNRYFSVGDDEYQYLQKSSTPTLHFQPSLPRLPIPELPKTCKRYLASLEPLMSNEQLNKTRGIVEKFQHEEGKALHEELIALDKENKDTSYISAPWFEMYLKAREPIILNYNPFMAFIDDPKAQYNNQLIRSTNMLISALRFRRSLKEGVLDPEVFHLNPAKSNTNTFRTVTRLLPSSLSWYGAYMFNAYALDMSQYSNLFNATRIPADGKDILYRDVTARHILVMKNGNFYNFDVLDQNGNILSPTHILKCMQYILEDKKPSPEYPVGILTSENRNAWATARKHLVKLGNENALKTIDSALFALLLDSSSSGNDPERLTRSMLYGDGANRWFDKSFQLIVAPDGKAAINFEHSWGDGVAIMRFVNEIVKDSIEKPWVHPDSTSDKIDPSSLVKCINFQLDDGAKQFITTAKDKYLSNTNGLGIHILQHPKFVKSYVKKKKVSPDAIMQLCFQMAYFRQTGKTVATYESCSTSAFRHGRTETIRPATAATKACSEAFSKTHRPPNGELRKLIDECSRVHNKLTKNAAMGQGFDRHLFALRNLANAKGMNPTIYADPSYSMINHNILSTSTVSSPNVVVGGFGPVVKDGYGVAYVIAEEIAGCVVTSYPPNQDGAKFVECVRSSMDDICDVLDAADDIST